MQAELPSVQTHEADAQRKSAAPRSDGGALQVSGDPDRCLRPAGGIQPHVPAGAATRPGDHPGAEERGGPSGSLQGHRGELGGGSGPAGFTGPAAVEAWLLQPAEEGGGRRAAGGQWDASGAVIVGGA